MNQDTLTDLKIQVARVEERQKMLVEMNTLVLAKISELEELTGAALKELAQYKTDRGWAIGSLAFIWAAVMAWVEWKIRK